MTSSIEFGKCRALLGVIGSTASELHERLSKDIDEVELVLEGASSVAYCDVVVVDTVATLMQCRSYFNSNMIVIVCDSIINIEKLLHCSPFDYTGDSVSGYSFVSKIPSPKKIEASIRPIAYKKINHVDENVRAILHIGFLTEYNTITAKMNRPARPILRNHLISTLKSGNSEELINYVASILPAEDCADFIDKLTSSYFTSLRNAVLAIYVSKSTLDEAKKKFNINEAYEITYLVKMLEETDGWKWQREHYDKIKKSNRGKGRNLV